MITPVEIKHTRIKVQLTPGGTDAWRFNLIDMDTGKIIPVSAEDNAIIEYNGPGNPVKATVTLFIDEIDVEAETTLIKVIKNER